MAIAIVGTPAAGSNGGGGAGALSVTTNLTLSSGVTKMLVPVAWEYGASRSVGSVTWNGTNLTQATGCAVAYDDGLFDWRGVDLWYLDSPAIGTYDLVTTISGGLGAASLLHGAVGVSGMATGTPAFEATTSSSSADPVTAATTTTAGNWALGIGIFKTATGTNVSSNNTQIFEDIEQTQTDTLMNVSYDTATSPTMSWATNGVRSTVVAIELSAAGGGTAGVKIAGQPRRIAGFGGGLAA